MPTIVSPADLTRLVVLASLWGASFLLFRIVVPTLGAIVTAESRVALAGVALLAWHAATRTPFAWRAAIVPLAVIGWFNSAMPFALFAFAAKSLPASYLAIVNATSPLAGALVARIWFGEALGVRRIAGIACGFAGVAALVGLGPVPVDGTTLLASAASFVAASSYGFAGNYAKRRATAIAPATVATGSQLAAAVLLLPLVPVEPVRAWPSGAVLVSMLALAIGCTAVAYLLYFRLIRDVGATRALTVTFLVPLFAVAWAWAVMGETPTPRMAIGAGLVVAATWLVIGGTATRERRAMSESG